MNLVYSDADCIIWPAYFVVGHSVDFSYNEVFQHFCMNIIRVTDIVKQFESISARPDILLGLVWVQTLQRSVDDKSPHWQ